MKTFVNLYLTVMLLEQTKNNNIIIGGNHYDA